MHACVSSEAWGGIAVALALVFSLLGPPTSASQAGVQREIDRGRVVSIAQHDGFRVIRYSNGVTFAGTGTPMAVDIITERHADGSVADRLVVTPGEDEGVSATHPVQREELLRAAGGRASAAQARDVSANTPPFASDCYVANTVRAYQQACYARYRHAGGTAADGDPGYNHPVVHTATTGTAKSGRVMTQQRTESYYVVSGVRVSTIGAQPLATTRSSCGDVQLSFDRWGVSLSGSFQLCPERIDPVISLNQFGAQWSHRNGVSAGIYRAIETIHDPRVPDGVPSGFTFESIIWTR